MGLQVHRTGTFRSGSCWFTRLTHLSLGLIGDRVCSDAIEPGGEGWALPFEFSDVCESLMKDVGSQVLNFRTIANPPRDVGIHAVKVLFV